MAALLPPSSCTRSHLEHPEKRINIVETIDRYGIECSVEGISKMNLPPLQMTVFHSWSFDDGRLNLEVLNLVETYLQFVDDSPVKFPCIQIIKTVLDIKIDVVQPRSLFH